MKAKEKAKSGINRIAETQYYIRHILVQGLKNQVVEEKAQHLLLNTTNYYEFWVKSFGDRFFDMSTLIRLGTELENGLKHYYMEKRGRNNLEDLQTDTNYTKNIFQRVQPWQSGNDNAISLFQNVLNYDLNSNTEFKKMQELMLCRHLYAHNSGLIDSDFVSRYLNLTGVDISQIPTVLASYPKSDTYYFAPLDKIPDLIESSKRFFDNLP